MFLNMHLSFVINAVAAVHLKEQLPIACPRLSSNHCLVVQVQPDASNCPVQKQEHLLYRQQKS
jgi:hypothetical protein